MRTNVCTAFLHMEHGWLARHQRTTIAIVFIIYSLTEWAASCL